MQFVPGDLYKYVNAKGSVPGLRVNGSELPLQIVNGFVIIDRSWKQGDVVEYDLPMNIKF